MTDVKTLEEIKIAKNYDCHEEVVCEEIKEEMIKHIKELEIEDKKRYGDINTQWNTKTIKWIKYFLDKK